MKVIGLTGGVACGKTTVANQLAQKGFPVIDTDEIARDLLARDQELQRKVLAEFGTLDRRQLRNVVFRDLEKRTRLEQMLHPPILSELRRRVAELKSRTSPPKVVVVVIPLLFEIEGETYVDEVLSVVSDRERQIARLINRDGISRELAERMVEAQLPNEEKERRATHVLRNDADLTTLLRAIDTLASKLV